MAWVPQARAELPAQDEVTYSGGYPATGLSPAPTADYAAGDEPTGAAAPDQPAEQATVAQPERVVLPQFLRKRSSPTPPED